MQDAATVLDTVSWERNKTVSAGFRIDSLAEKIDIKQWITWLVTFHSWKRYIQDNIDIV